MLSYVQPTRTNIIITSHYDIGQTLGGNRMQGMCSVCHRRRKGKFSDDSIELRPVS